MTKKYRDHDYMVSLIGTQVVATINEEPLIELNGCLLALSDFGQAYIRDDETGETWHSWPVLRMRPADEPESAPAPPSFASPKRKDAIDELFHHMRKQRDRSFYEKRKVQFWTTSAKTKVMHAVLPWQSVTQPVCDRAVIHRDGKQIYASDPQLPVCKWCQEALADLQ